MEQNMPINGVIDSHANTLVHQQMDLILTRRGVAHYHIVKPLYTHMDFTISIYGRSLFHLWSSTAPRVE